MPAACHLPALTPAAGRELGFGAEALGRGAGWRPVGTGLLTTGVSPALRAASGSWPLPGPVCGEAPRDAWG